MTILDRGGASAMADEHADVRAAVDEARTQAMVTRVRQVATACLVVLFLLIVARWVSPSAIPQNYTPLRFAGFVGVAAFLAFTHHPSFARRQVLWSWMMVTAIGALAAVGAAARDNAAIGAILQAGLLMLTGAVLPWGPRPQAAVVASCSVLLYGVYRYLGPYPAEHPDLPVIFDAYALFGISLFVSRHTRRNFDEAATEHLRLAAARERIRAQAEDLDARVRARTAELEATLADQREMTRAISHDVRQPLRHIGGFSQMLLDDLGDSLDAEHRDRLARVCRATIRMDHMVDALLEISRVAGTPLVRESVDLSRLAREVAEELRRSEPGREVEVTIEDGLACRGDAGLVRSLLQVLLGNAWKFTRGRTPARLVVGREGSAFLVRDNGLGFDMRHAAKMFATFERLHHVDEFEGEGVGLAIAERVVRRHGGRIEARGEPGKGATFVFTLEP